MRALKFMGGSAVCLYLICAVLAVMSFPVSADKCADADCVSVSQAVDVQAETVEAVVAGDEVDKVDAFLDKVPAWLKLAGLITTAFSVIAAVTPTPKDDGALLLLRKLIDGLAFNIGNAKSAASIKNRYNLL